MGQMSTLVGKVSLLGIGGYALIKGTLTFGEYFAYSILVQYTYRAVGYLVEGNIAYQQSKAVMKRMAEVLSGNEGTPHDFQKIYQLKKASNEPLRKIVVDNLHFRYSEESKDVLCGISTEFNSGEIVAIVGSSGAGKTSLVGLLKREYKLQKGEILVNNIPIKEIDRDYYIARTATVRQTPFIFSGTIKHNILMGQTASKDELNSVVEQAYLKTYIDCSPNGIDTDMSENAINISGGQKQRVALARAFLRNPDILFLDEITTGMDKITRDKIHNSISRLKKHSIVIIITHTAETVQIADRIILLDQGTVVCEGTHTELYYSSKLYRQLFERMEENETNT